MTPSTSSSEYRRNPGLALIKPQAAWTQGATGAGITVAVIDGGVSTSQTDLAGRLIIADVIPGRTGEPSSEHGTSVAGVIGSGFNGVFTVGVAYESTILGIRADSTLGCDDDDGCGFTSHDLAVAIDYARTHGAQVINISLGSDTGSGRETRDALQRATDAGIIVVASAGNDAASDPGYPGRYAVDSRYAGALVATGALNAGGTALASFSNRAGVAMEGYIAAPGEDIWTNCETTSAGSFCSVVSGTSFAAPHVAGALALVLDGFPNLTGREALDILLRTARDMGATGTDAIFGRGALDIERAFQPIGALSSPTSSGKTFVMDSVGSGALAGAAFGDAWSAPNLQTVGYDDYRRLYRINLGDAWRSAGRAHPLPSPAPAAQRSSVVQALDGGGSLRFSASSSAPERIAAVSSGLTTGRGQEASAVSIAKGALRLDLWSGRGGAAPTFEDAPADAFVSLAQAGQATRAGLALGRWTLSAEGGSSLVDPAANFDLMVDPRTTRGERTRYSRAVASFNGGRWSLALGSGALVEPAGPLGSSAPALSGFAMAAKSRFASVQAAWRPTDGLGVTLQGSEGRTEAQGSLLSIADARSSNWAMNADLSCARIGLAACGGLSFSVAQPLRVSGGRATAILADVPAEYFDPLTYSQRIIDLSPTGREIDVGLGVWRPAGRGDLRLQAIAQFNPGHRAEAPAAYGLNASFRTPF